MESNTSPRSTRRRLLQGLGAGSALALAGCLGNPPRNDVVSPESTPTLTASPPAAEPGKPAQAVDVDRIAADPTDIPSPITRSSPADVEVTLETQELVAEIEDGVTFTYMTFGGQVPGPMIRVRRGDRVTLTLKNSASNAMVHNIDCHAIYGPGGGAEATVVAPGEEATIQFTAMYPGAFIYHCAVPNLDYHISSGMFGMLLVEPEGGLPEVDHEFYFGQNEIYTDRPKGEAGHHGFDFAAMRAEDPTYVLMNGEQYAITENGHGPVSVKRGDTARVFFVCGGPNLTSSFHPIGNVWTEIWAEGALASDPERYVQTKPVAPGSCAVATMEFPVPGPVKLVDHALSRVVNKGCMAVIDVEGAPNPAVFQPNA